MRRPSNATRLVLLALLDADEPVFGLSVMRTTGLSSGTVYPLLSRLETEGLATSDGPQEAPRQRRTYHLTRYGTLAAAAMIRRTDMPDDLEVRRVARARTQRMTYVRDCLNLELADQRIELAWVDGRTWSRPTIVRDAGEHYGMGFTPPFLLHDQFMVFACAEVLVDAADHLDDEDFFAYVRTIAAHLRLHIIEMERTLADVHPELVELGVLASQRATTPESGVYDSVRDRTIKESRQP